MIRELTGPLVDAYHERTFRQLSWLWLVSDEKDNAFALRMGWPIGAQGELPF